MSDRRINNFTLLILMFLLPPVGIYLASLTPWTGKLINKPVAYLSIILAQMLVVSGVILGMIANNFPFWQILLGSSAVFASISLLNLVIWQVSK